MSDTEETPKNTNWQNEWPSETGFWWFYGKTFKSTKIELHFVKVINTAVPGTLVYITNGHFLYQEEGATGCWTKVQLPELPT